MRKILKLSCIIIIICACLTLAKSEDVSAKVKYTVSKSGTLTISGKGVVSTTNYTKKHPEIKKIVIKSGITSIKTVYAFIGCTNCTEVTVAPSVKSICHGAFSIDKLQKITIPGDFKTIYSGEDEENGMFVSRPVLDCALNEVVFNTSLNVKVCTYFTTMNFITYSKDKKYKSYNGVIYTKDGKELVRVPLKRKAINIREGCTDFDLWAIEYGFSCDPAIAEITIPSSVIRINDTNNKGYDRDYSHIDTWCEKVIIKSKQLTGKSISVLYEKFFKISIDDIYQQIPECITKDKNGYYITNDHVLLCYAGDESAITVPDGVQVIGLNVLGKKRNYQVKEVSLPDSVTEIMRYAFWGSEALESIKLPSSLESIGYAAFEEASIKELVLPKKLKTIGKYAFKRNMLTEITIPKSVKTIGVQAFCDNYELKNITINCPITDNISKNIFSENMKPTIKFGSDISKSKYFTHIISRGTSKSSKYRKANLTWSKIIGVTGYQVQISTSSKFTSSKTEKATIKSADTTSTGIVFKKSTKNPSYARIRPYVTKSGKTTYGQWVKISL
ncbi:MAG: leucine-rich repeat domain-containing protein [Lachnospiraceae bacterium]|nr:leucine-rich repeat domain-containing protein [Lachnospiraceae bacterium]